MTILNQRVLEQLLADLKHFLNHVLKSEKLSSAAHDARASMLDRVSTVLTEIQPTAAEEEEDIYDAPNDEDNDTPDSVSRLSDTTNNSNTSEPDFGTETSITLPAEAMTTAAMKASASKHGPLFRKEKFLFVDQFRRCWAAIYAHCIFIYNSDKDSKPVNVYVLNHYEARAAPHLTKDKNKKDQYFEMVSPGKKTQLFMARTAKDMQQWITAINSESEVIGFSKLGDDVIAKIMRELPQPPIDVASVPIESEPPQTYEHMIEQEESEEVYYNIDELGLNQHAVNTEEQLEEYDDIEHFNNEKEIPLPPRPVPNIPGTSRPVPNIPGVPLPVRAVPFVPGTSRAVPPGTSRAVPHIPTEEEEEEYDDIDQYHKTLPPPASNSSAKPMLQNNSTLFRNIPKPPEKEEEEEYDDIDATQKSPPPVPAVPPANNKPVFPRKESRPVPQPPTEELEEEYDDIDASQKSPPPVPAVPPANNKPVFPRKESRPVPQPPTEELEEEYDDIDAYHKSLPPPPTVPSPNNKPTMLRKDNRAVPEPPNDEEQYDDIDAFNTSDVPPPPKLTNARPSVVPPPVPKAFKELPPRSVVLPKALPQTFNQNKSVHPFNSKPKTMQEPEEEYDDIDSFQNKDSYYNVDSPNKVTPSKPAPISAKTPPPPPIRTSTISTVSTQPSEEDFYDDVGSDTPTTPNWPNKSIPDPNTGSFIHQLQSKINSNKASSTAHPVVNKIQTPVRSSGPPLASQLGSALSALKPVAPLQNKKPFTNNVSSKPGFLDKTSKPELPVQSSKPGFLNQGSKPVLPSQENKPVLPSQTGTKPGFLKTRNQFPKPNVPSAMSKPGVNQFKKPGASSQINKPGNQSGAPPISRVNSGNIQNLIKQMQASLAAPPGMNGEDTYEPVIRK